MDTNDSGSRLPSAEDHLAIVDLWARYCMYLDRGDLEGYLQLFTPDAVYQVYGRDVVGHEKMRKLLSGAPHGLHLGGNPVIEMVEPDRANTFHNLYFVPAAGDPRRAVYQGQLVRTIEGWRIARWRCQFITTEGLQDKP